MKLVKWLIPLFTLIVCFLLIELIFSQFTHTDKDQNQWFRTRMLRPYQLPLSSVEQNVYEYLNTEKAALLSYHPTLGWTNSSNYGDKGGNYHHDSLGRRVANRFEKAQTDSSQLSVALFGDSYIYGAEVEFEQSIGHQLQEQLEQLNINTEVHNYGVGAYGMDQAFLRWRNVKKSITADIIIFGFQAENMARNLNLIRALYSRKEALPFFKPRFSTHNEQLKLINSPTPIPDSLAIKLNQIENWKWQKQEAFYNANDYSNYLLRYSSFLSYCEDVLKENRFTIRENERELYKLNGKAAILALKLIEQFAEEVESYGSKFYLVHIPRKLDVQTSIENEEIPYSAVLNNLKEKHTIIDPLTAFANTSKSSSIQDLFAPQQHYSEVGNLITAKAIAEFIKKEYAH